MKLIVPLTLVTAITVPGRAEFQLAQQGVARSVIIVDSGITATEAFAAREWALHLGQSMDESDLGRRRRVDAGEVGDAL